MVTRLMGGPVAKALQNQMKAHIAEVTKQGYHPKLKILRVGQRKDDIAYEQSIIKVCKKLEIKCECEVMDTGITQDQLIKVIQSANQDESIHGMMVFRPLPDHIDITAISAVIAPEKDVDSMSIENMQKIFEGSNDHFVPCTAEAVMELLKYYEIPIQGADVTVIGTSLVVGRPLSLLLINEWATVTMCHIETKDIKRFSKEADIVVVAVGAARFFDDSYFGQDTVVVDVGINDDGQGGICGDVDYKSVSDKVKAITPTVGGVGTITTTILLKHVLSAMDRQIEASGQKTKEGLEDLA